MSERYDQVPVSSRAEWRAWLADHHADSPGIWAVTHKKTSAGPYVSYDDLVEEALAFGWVDSVRRSVDEERSRLLMTPRRPKSGWSRPNKERIERLTAAGLMAPAGLAAVARAKENGTWTALDAVENLEEPDDLAAALNADARARTHWDAFPRSAKRGILEWILNAKRPDTRARRIEETARLASDDIRANQPRQPGGR